MEIMWYGHCAFRVGERGRYMLMDPYGPEMGRELSKKAAEVVTISRDDPAHNYSRLASGRPYVISGPGEYEVAGIFITGISTDRGADRDKEHVRNTVYVVEFDDLVVCHLGALSHVPAQEQIEELGELADIDILMVPIGGKTVLTAARAAEVVALLEPRLVLPMHYRVRGLATEGDTATRFLREMAVEEPETSLCPTPDMLRITAKSQLPEQIGVVLLEASQ
jgi:L-ascorbate metabolism protein UlaG (beta-lactamase superfamily)